MMKQNIKRYNGFTLIELLVVISVIAVLSAILFPVISSAKKQAYQTKCAANLKNFAGAFSMYASDWGGRLPLPGGLANSNSMFWLHSEGSGLSGKQVGGLWRYIKTSLKPGDKTNLWSCPLAGSIDTKWVSFGYSPGQTYIMNDYIRAGHPGQNQFNYSLGEWQLGMLSDSCPKASRTILLYEGVQYSIGTCARHGSPFYIQTSYKVHPSFEHLKYPNIPQDYHAGRSNFLFLDGHVQLLKPSDTLRPQSAALGNGKTDIDEWMEVHGATGKCDMWNPRVSGVNYP